jgi:hypothetical protein
VLGDSNASFASSVGGGMRSKRTFDEQGPQPLPVVCEGNDEVRYFTRLVDIIQNQLVKHRRLDSGSNSSKTTASVGLVPTSGGKALSSGRGDSSVVLIHRYFLGSPATTGPVDRIEARTRQINLGKQTIGYRNFSALYPK